MYVCMYVHVLVHYMYVMHTVHVLLVHYVCITCTVHVHVCMYVHVCIVYNMYSGTSQAQNTHHCLFLDQYFLKKKSETSSEDNSARVVCLDGSLSAPRSRTWRTCFYLSLVISQPEPNI